MVQRLAKAPVIVTPVSFDRNLPKGRVQEHHETLTAGGPIGKVISLLSVPSILSSWIPQDLRP